MATKFYNLDTDNTLGGNSPSDYHVPSQKAVKEYVDNNSGASITVDSTLSPTSTNPVQNRVITNVLATKLTGEQYGTIVIDI